MTDKQKNNLSILHRKIEAIEEALEMIQVVLAVTGCESIAYGSIADARANLANATCEIKKEMEE